MSHRKSRSLHRDSFESWVEEALISAGVEDEKETRETTKTPPDSKNKHKQERRYSVSPPNRGKSESRRERTPHRQKVRSVSPNNQRVLSGQQILEQNVIDMKSMSLEAEEKLSNRSKKGEIYDEVLANLKSKSIKKRLKNLSKNKHTFSIDEAIEISDAACLLRLLRKPEHEIELAGQLAHSGALLLLQADMLTKKGRELLSQSKSELQSAAL